MNPEHPVLAAGAAVLKGEGAPWAERKNAMLAFEKQLLASPNPPDAAIMAELSPFFPRLNRLYRRYETDLEIAFVSALLAGKQSVDEYLLFSRFETLVANEVKLAGLKRGDEVAMIGSGPLPVTAIILSAAFGLKVTAIERDPHAAKLSRQVIAKLGLEDQIEIAMESGEQFVARGATSAIVAVLAEGKQAILANIFARYPRCPRVVCRTSDGIRQALYQPADEIAFARYRLLSKNVARLDQTISSMLLAR